MSSRTAFLLAAWGLMSCAGDDDGTGAQLASANVTSGLYHLPDRVDAVSLELKDDHTFRWAVQGCDYGGADQGRWSIVNGEVRLSPREGKSTFQWFGELSVHDVSTLTLRDAPGAEPELRVTLVEQDTSHEQSWLPGGVCAVCGGTLGPTSQRDCDAPFQQLDAEERL